MVGSIASEDKYTGSVQTRGVLNMRSRRSHNVCKLQKQKTSVTCVWASENILILSS